MELKDWMQLITSWAAIAVTIWIEVRRASPTRRAGPSGNAERSKTGSG
ncbi:hypothetical protein ACE15Y_10550 [Bifidobacterium bifidum]